MTDKRGLLPAVRTPQQQRGDDAERQAEACLIAAGLRIRGRNVRVGHDEVDLVAEDRDALGPLVVFVEVRRRPTAVDALESIHGPKRRKLVRAAARYLAAGGDRERARFDVVIVTPREVRHLKDAFRPETF